MDTTSPLMYHVNEATPTSAPGGEGFISLGTLAIFSLEEEDSGIVECIASVVGDEETTGGVEVPRDMEETQLAILGEEGGREGREGGREGGRGGEGRGGEGRGGEGRGGEGRGDEGGR